MTVIEITEETQFNSYIEGMGKEGKNKYIFVDFKAVWCQPCKRIEGDIESFSEKYKEITFLKVDIDQCKDLATRYQIRSIPTFLIFTVGSEEPSPPIIGSDLNKIEYALKLLTSSPDLEYDF